MRTLVYTSKTAGNVAVELIFLDLFSKDLFSLTEYCRNKDDIINSNVSVENATTHIMVFKTDEAYQQFLELPFNLFNIINKIYNNADVIEFMKDNPVSYELYWVKEKDMIRSR